MIRGTPSDHVLWEADHWPNHAERVTLVVTVNTLREVSIAEGVSRERAVPSAFEPAR
jgi:hypothetical protein